MTNMREKHSDTVWLKNGYARNSFDRFGDDSCQEMLQYLTFRDKVRLECVSRQWKRSVYAKQHTLHIEDTKKLTFNGLPVTKLLLNYGSDATKSVPQLTGKSVIERLLAKCAHIRHIVIRTTFSCANKTITYDHLLRLIADKCGDLVSLEYCEDQYNRISENAWKYLAEKTFKTFKTYVCGTDPFWRFADSHYKTLLKLCSNLMTINNIKLRELINEEIIAPQLYEVKLTNGTDETELMDTFISRYKNTVKIFESGYNGHGLNNFMTQLSQLCLLEDLSLFMSGVDISQFGVNFKNIAVNCSQLKYLSLDLDNTLASEMSYTKLFNSINCCSQLTYLYVVLIEEYTVNNNDSNKLSVELLKGCAQLTHLNITIDIIDDKFFAGIERCFPQLKVIDIQSNKQLTDKTMHSLAKVKTLKTVIIRDFDKRLQITDKGVCDVIENCVQLKSFSFNYVPPLITRKTIVKLIEIARRRPKINFNHRFVVQRRADNSKIIDYIASQKIKCSYPANLKMNH